MSDQASAPDPLAHDYLDLDRLDALADNATPGPWTPTVDSDRGWFGEEYGRWWYPSFNERPFSKYGMDDLEEQANADAAFLCAARTAVPELVREVRRLRAELAEARRE